MGNKQGAANSSARREGCGRTAQKGKAPQQVLVPGEGPGAPPAHCPPAAAAHSPQEAPELGGPRSVQSQCLAGRPPPAQAAEQPRRPRQEHRSVSPQRRVAHADRHVGVRPLRQQPARAQRHRYPLPVTRTVATAGPPAPTCSGPAAAARPAPLSAAAAPPSPGRGPLAQLRYRSAPCAGSHSAPRYDAEARPAGPKAERTAPFPPLGPRHGRTIGCGCPSARLGPRPVPASANEGSRCGARPRPSPWRLERPPAGGAGKGAGPSGLTPPSAEGRGGSAVPALCPGRSPPPGGASRKALRAGAQPAGGASSISGKGFRTEIRLLCKQ